MLGDSYARAATVASAAILLLVGSGCGEAKAPAGGGTKFPTREALEELAARPIKPAPRHAVASVPEWGIDAESVSESPVTDPRFVVGAAGPADRSFRCAARELARFHAEHGAVPNERVQRFIYGACGIASRAGVETRWFAAPPETPDESFVTSWNEQLAPIVQGRPAGAALVRGKQAVLMVVLGKVAAPQVSVSSVDEAGRVTVQGSVEPDVDYAVALVNRSRDGVADCEPDRSIDLPRFSFRCTLAEADPWAWIQVAARTAGRVLMHESALVLARRDPRAPLELTRGVGEALASSSQGTAAAIIDGINRARQSAKLAALALAPKQTDVNARLAGHYFSAELGGDGRTTDLVALGLLAGWDVEGLIQSGDIYSEMLSGSTDAGSWLDDALDQPMGRRTLLRPEARQLALGLAPPQSIGGIGVVLTTYSFFGAENHEANAERVLKRLAELRAARGLSEPKVMKELPPLTKAAQLVAAGGREPLAALRVALDEEGERTGRSMMGLTIQTHDLDDLPFSKEFLTPGPLWVRVSVTQYRPEGSPWGAYVVYIVKPAPVQQRVAAARPPTSGSVH